MYVIRIELGNHTTVTRMIDADKENPTVNLFGMKYTLADLISEGWHYEIEYLGSTYAPQAYRS